MEITVPLLVCLTFADCDGMHNKVRKKSEGSSAGLAGAIGVDTLCE